MYRIVFSDGDTDCAVNWEDMIRRLWSYIDEAVDGKANPDLLTQCIAELEGIPAGNLQSLNDLLNTYGLDFWVMS